MLEKFHENLLGTGPNHSQYMLSDVHRKLYTSFASGRRGYLLSPNVPRENFDKFLATFVLALYQTTIPTPDNVSMVVARAVERWSIDQLKMIVRHVFSIRKNQTRASVKPLEEALNRLHLGSRVLHIPEGPPRWVSYGYHSNDILPPWMRCNLIK